MSCEELMDRWAHLYEMYKTFRLKHIKDENILANMEVKYSKYLATLHFLYKIDEEDLKKENLSMQDCGNLDELPENDLNLQDMPDDREFVFALVSAVKPCVILWHHRHLDYNDNTRRDRMWQEIEEKLKDFKRNYLIIPLLFFCKIIHNNICITGDAKTIKLRWQLAKFCYLRWRRERHRFGNNEPPKYCKNLPVDEMKFLNIYN